MAYLIFNKNTSNLYKIAANQTFMDANKGFHNEHVDIVEISESDFNNLKFEITSLATRNENTVTWNTLNVKKFNKHNELQNDIDWLVGICDNWLNLEVNSSKSMYSSVSDYRDYLKGLDISTIITEPSADATYNEASNSYSDGTPLSKSLIKYVSDQGQTAYHPLELF